MVDVFCMPYLISLKSDDIAAATFLLTTVFLIAHLFACFWHRPYCTGEESTPCTRELLDLQAKFNNPVQQDDGDGSLVQMVYRGGGGPDVDWDSVDAAAEPTPEEWKTYKEQPFTSREEYMQ